MVKATNYIVRGKNARRAAIFLRERRATHLYLLQALMMHLDQPPEELNRLDSKIGIPRRSSHSINSPTPCLADLWIIIVLDQVDTPETGVVTQSLLDALARFRQLPHHRRQPSWPKIGRRSSTK